MKNEILACTYLVSGLATGMIAPTKPDDAVAWYQKMENGINKWTQEDNVDVKIENLSDYVMKFGEQIPGHADPRWHQAFKHAQAALLATPGHAKYFQDKIESLRTEVLATGNISDEELTRLQDEGREIPHVTDYERYCSMTAFPTLQHLPSAETVAVLGHYLNDPVGRNGKNLLGYPMRIPGDDLTSRPCNARMATESIRHLGIEHPPYPFAEGRPGEYLPEKEIGAWKDWWNEVKAGKRTYRFKGSPIEYGADGPATKEQIERISMHQRMESDREARHGGNAGVKDDGRPAADSPVSRKPATYAIIAAALALLVSIVWRFRRAKAAR